MNLNSNVSNNDSIPSEDENNDNISRDDKISIHSATSSVTSVNSLARGRIVFQNQIPRSILLLNKTRKIQSAVPSYVARNADVDDKSATSLVSEITNVETLQSTNDALHDSNLRVNTNLDDVDVELSNFQTPASEKSYSSTIFAPPNSNDSITTHGNLTCGSASTTFSHITPKKAIRQSLRDAWFKFDSKPSISSLRDRREEVIRVLRQKYEYPNGLAKEMCKTIVECPVRIWLLDNSSSMNTKDGSIFVRMQGRTKQAITCTRWKELEDTVKFHATLASDIYAPTLFRFLIDPALTSRNDPAIDYNQNINIGVEEKDCIYLPPSWSLRGYKEERVFNEDDSELHRLDHLFKEVSLLLHSYFCYNFRATNLGNYPMTQTLQITPKYTAPLTQDLKTLAEHIRLIKDNLKQSKISIIIATDGIPEDAEKFFAVMQEFESLPVVIVVRMCSSDDETSHFWRCLDLDLNIHLDLIDDYVAEASEVASCNPWLTYTQSMHRAREFGLIRRCFDLIDECLLREEDMVIFLSILFGVNKSDLSEPKIDWEKFYDDIKALSDFEGLHYDPLSLTYKNWISMRELGNLYGGKQEIKRRRRLKRCAKSPMNVLREENVEVPLQENESDESEIFLEASKPTCCVIS